MKTKSEKKSYAKDVYLIHKDYCKDCKKRVRKAMLKDVCKLCKKRNDTKSCNEKADYCVVGSVRAKLKEVEK